MAPNVQKESTSDRKHEVEDVFTTPTSSSFSSSGNANTTFPMDKSSAAPEQILRNLFEGANALVVTNNIPFAKTFVWIRFSRYIR